MRHRRRLPGWITLLLLAGFGLGLSGCATTRPSTATHAMITVIGDPGDVDAFVRLVDARRGLPTFDRILASGEQAPVFIVGTGAMVHQYLPRDRRLESEAFPGDLFLAPGVQYIDLQDLDAFPKWMEVGVTVPGWAVTHDTILAHILAEGAHGAATHAEFAASHHVGIEAENELRTAQGQEGRILYRQMSMDGSRSGQPILETGILNDTGGIWVERVHSAENGEIRSIEYYEAGLLVATRTIDTPPASLATATRR